MKQGKQRRPFQRGGPGAGYQRPQSRRPDSDASGDDGPLRLFGVHAVEAALANPLRTILRLAATENAENRLAAVIAGRSATVERVSPRDLDRLLGTDTVHQGVMLETEPLPEPSFEEIAERALHGGPLVILDQVTDPHNVGAVIRSCAVFGASALVVTRRHSPPLNGTLAKSASGALELVPVLLVPNLNRAMQELKQQGVVMLGLDGTAEAAIEDEPFDGAVALVLGAEGRGLRQLTAETCDRQVRISTAGSLASLNVSNAAAVALHCASLSRRRK